MIQWPCRDCKNREVGCHATCEAYMKYKLANQKEHDAINQIKYNQSLTYTYTKRRNSINMKKKGKRNI